MGKMNKKVFERMNNVLFMLNEKEIRDDTAENAVEKLVGLLEKYQNKS